MTISPLFIFQLGIGVGVFLYGLELVWMYLGLAFSNDRNQSPDDQTPISLIIAARDEEEQLRKHLPLWLNQKHACYEVIVVNDCSYDQTKNLLAEYQRKYPHLHVVNMEDTALFKGGKKIALSMGIKGAQFERLIFTDADCYPTSKRWLAEMNGRFSDKIDVVLGMGQYEKRKGFLNYLIRMDTFQIAIQYLGMAASGFPIMAVGRNLGYKKSLFDKHQGFKSHMQIKWGDDDLFINEAARGQNTSICVHPWSQTLSIPKDKWRKWIDQKRRHMSVSQHYRFLNKVLFMIKPLRIMIYYSSIIFGLIFQLPYNFLILTTSLVYIAHIALLILLQKRIGKIEGLLFFPLTEGVLLLFNTLIYITLWFKKPKTWS